MNDQRNKSRERESNLYNQIAISVLSLNEEQAKLFINELSQEKAEYSYYKKLFNAMRQGLSYKDCLNVFTNDKRNLRQWLDNLKDRLIDFALDIDREQIFKLINKAEAAFKIGMEVQGVQIIEELEKKLKPEDFWLSWRIYELKFVYYDLVKRLNINTPNDLYFFVSSIMRSGTDSESNFYELSRYSDFVSFLEKTRRGSFKEIENFKAISERIDNLYNKVYSDSSTRGNGDLLKTFNPEIDHLELMNLVDETVNCIFFAIKNRLYDTHRTLLNRSLQMIELLKQLLTGTDFSGPMGWPNLLSVYFVQKQSELNICMSFLNEKAGIKSEHERVFPELNAINNIAHRIQVLDIIGRIFALQYGYGPAYKFELELEKIHEDITSILNTKNKLSLPIYIRNCLKTLKVLLAETSGLNNLKKSGSYGSTKREILALEKFKDFVSLKQLDLDFDSCSNYIEYAMVKVYKMAWQRKNAKRNF